MNELCSICLGGKTWITTLSFVHDLYMYCRAQKLWKYPRLPRKLKKEIKKDEWLWTLYHVGKA